MNKKEMALELISNCEGCKLKAYYDEGKIITIGFGTTKYPSGKCVRLNDTCILEEAKDWLNDYLERFVYTSVDNLQDEIKFNDKMYASICSLAYNVGGIIFDPKKSPNFLASLKSNDLTRIAVAFKRFIRVNGEVSEGLVNRRNKEIKYFMEE